MKSTPRRVAGRNCSPRVSVIIPCHNGGVFLAEAIQSVLDQTFTLSEVIVVDDGSMDNSAAVAKSFGPPVRLLQNPRRMERSWSRNRGVRESRGDLIALLDADDIWLPHKLERQVPLFQQPDVAMTHSRACEFSDEDGCRRFGHTAGWSFPGQRGDRTLIRGNRVTALTAVMRRDCFEKVGGFDCQRDIQGCEDFDLWLRLANKFRVEFQPDVQGYYRCHSAQSTRNVAEILIRDARVRERFVRRFPDVLDCAENRDTRHVLYGKVEDAAWECLERRNYRSCAKLCAFLFHTNPRLWWKPWVRSVLGSLCAQRPGSSLASREATKRPVP